MIGECGPPIEAREPDHLTITLTGPQGCGKTQTKEWLERNLPFACNGVHYRAPDGGGRLLVTIIDGGDHA